MQKMMMWLIAVMLLISCNAWGEEQKEKISIIARKDALTYICVDGLSFIRAENTHNAIALLQVIDRNGKPKSCENK